MRPFFKHLEKFIDKHYLFDLYTARDLECFAIGSFLASKVYNQEDPEVLGFEYFNEFVRGHYKVALKRDWGEILDFYCAPGSSIFDEYKLLQRSFKSWFLQTKPQKEPDYLTTVKTKFSACKNFAQIMNVLKAEYLNIGITQINQFDKFYLGILSYGDTDRGEAYLGNMKDESFVNLSEINNPFSLYIASDFKISPVHSYASMIRYISGSRHSMELFVQLYYDFIAETANDKKVRVP